MHASVNIRHFFHKQWNNVTDPKFWKVYCRINVVRMLLECELVAYESNYLIFGETTRWGNPCAISTACVWLQRGSPPAAQNARSVFSSCRVIEEHIELASGPAGQVSKVMATLLSGHSSPVPSVIMHTHTHTHISQTGHLHHQIKQEPSLSISHHIYNEQETINRHISTQYYCISHAHKSKH